MTASTILRIARNGTHSTTPHGRPWRILLDGNDVGSITKGQTVDIPVASGSHVVQLQSTKLLLSSIQSFDAGEHETIGYSCRPRPISPIVFTQWTVWFLMSMVNHNLWIGMKRNDDLSAEHAITIPTDMSTLDPKNSGETKESGAVALNARSLTLNTTRAPTDAATKSVLVVNNLTKRFGERTAFSDVSFEVGYGEVFGFLGPNGAGKTTTVRTLGTLITPTSGSATVAGIPLLPENGVEIRQRAAIMPESPGLYLRLSVSENLQYFAGLYGLRHAEKRINDALAAVNLSDRASDLCGGLSKGLRQRVGLARTLLSDPAIMFLDEPTSGLDPVASHEVHNLIIGLRERGVSIFLTTHRLDEAEKLCDRVGIMNTKLRTVGRPGDLRDQLFKRSLVVKTLAPLSDPKDLFSRITAVDDWRMDGEGDYILTVSDPRVAAPEVTRALVNVEADVLSLSESQHSLEDVYLELIASDVEASK
jgi:ABC-2 type transport system ATP-binding protein